MLFVASAGNNGTDKTRLLDSLAHAASRS